MRIDFMIDTASNTLYVNEINTIPGSLAFYLWEPKGMPYAKLHRPAGGDRPGRQDGAGRPHLRLRLNLLSTAKLGGGAKGAKGVKQR